MYITNIVIRIISRLNYISRAKNFRTKKRLGQNFLIDSQVIEKILSESQIKPDDIILEIGPGIGFVTEQLVKNAKRIIAVEIDKYAVEELNKLEAKNLEIIENDILKTDISELSDKKLKIIANIPYYITSPILVHLLGEIDDSENKNRKSIEEIILMVQYEVAKRIVANEKSPSKEYGALSLLCNYHCETEIIQKVGRKSFLPSPKVDSALIRLKVKEEPTVKVNNPSTLRKIIRAAFSTRRKTIKNALKNSGFSEELIKKALQKAYIEETVRGEKLSMQDFATLSDIMDELS